MELSVTVVLCLRNVEDFILFEDQVGHKHNKSSQQPPSNSDSFPIRRHCRIQTVQCDPQQPLQRVAYTAGTIFIQPSQSLGTSNQQVAPVCAARMLQMLRLLAIIGVLHVCAFGLSAITDLGELSYDENDRLISNYLLYTPGPNCNIRKGELAYRTAHPLSDELTSTFFGSNPASYGKCGAVCVQKGTLREHIPHPLPSHLGTNLTDVYGFAHENCQKTEVGFLSYNPNVATIYWVDKGNRIVPVGTLKYGEKNTVWQVSYLGHRFLIQDTVTQATLLELTVTHDSVYHIGEHKSALQVRDVELGVKHTFKMEWNRANRVARTFTPFGFSKGRMPTDLWASVSAYYYNNRNNRVLEEWDSKGLYVNWWERDVFFIPMPWVLKTTWQKRIKLLVEEWTGVDLETTDIYGMRRYEDGARLLTHVDREATHAASIIMNIAQGDIRTPWKVEIYDFAGRLHEVEMEPGDIVYYESARCLHGRMRPLDGGYYVNLFAHYRPTGDPEWFLKPNPPGTPQPVLDIGTCTTDGVKASCTGAEVPYLSPSLETLHGPDDLFRYWKETTPQPAPEKPHEEL